MLDWLCWLVGVYLRMGWMDGGEVRCGAFKRGGVGCV